MTGERKKGLASKLLSVVCCCDGRTLVSSRCCWSATADDRTKKDVEHVIDDRKSDGGKPEEEEEGYDNAACTERRMTSGQAAEVDMVSALYHRIEARRISTTISTPPVIDWKAVEFWTATARRPDSGQQSVLLPPPADGRRSSSPSPCEAHGLRPQLYEEKEGNEEEEEKQLTDDQKLDKFRLGQLRFGLRYDQAGRRLLVSVLAGRQLTGSDPYVRVCLLPDRKGGQRTVVKRGGRSPVFEQTFAFEVSSQAEVRRRTLRLKVGEMDGRTLGHVLLPLAGVGLDRGRPVWKPLVPCEKEQEDLGEIFVSLNYLPSAGRLNVDVIKAKQLLQTDLDGGSALFVRVTLVQEEQKPPAKSKKTSGKKDTTDPVYEESFSFRLSPTALADASLVLSAWRRDRAREEALVGRVVLGRSASGPHEKGHWERVVAAHRSPVARWHSLRSRRECDRLSPASRLVP